MVNKLIAVLLFLCAVPCLATTYYVDYAGGSDSNAGTSTSTPWKRAPGMTSFAATYTHSATCDTFIFKGGVTWPAAAFPWTISRSGIGGSCHDTYTVDASWYTGSAYASPIFTRSNGNVTANSTSLTVTGSYVLIHGLSFKEFAPPYPASPDAQTLSTYGIKITNGSNVQFDGNTVATNDRVGVYMLNNANGTQSNISITNNDISKSSWTVSVGTYCSTAGCGASFSNVVITGNTIHDLHTAITNGVHANGIISFNQPGTDTTQTIQATVANNIFSGDWSPGDSDSASLVTAPIFMGLPSSSTSYVYNNLSVFTSSTGGASGCLYLGGTGAGTTYVLNNTCYLGPSVLNSSRITSTSPNMVWANNILYGGTSSGILCQTGSCGTFNNDDIYDWGINLAAFSTTTYATLSALQADGYETNGAAADPLLGSSYIPQSGSPVIGLGQNFTALCTAQPGICLDLAGKARPTSARWDAGAYQYASLTSTTTTLTSSSYSVAVGNLVTLTATVAPIATTGTVTFYDSTTSATLGTSSVTGGVATLSTSFAISETHSLYAAYSGDTSYNGSTSSNISIVVTGGLSSIAVTPTAATISIGGAQQYVATCTPVSGSPYDCTTASTWTSSSTGFATISSGGLATGLLAGSTTITAAQGSISSPGVTLTIVRPSPATGFASAGFWFVN